MEKRLLLVKMEKNMLRKLKNLFTKNGGLSLLP